ncbi:MAG: YqhA family protein [Vicinamibacterales bacterium]
MSRYLIGIAVVGTFLGATALLMYGVIETLAVVQAVLAVWWPAAGHAADIPPLLAAIAAVDAFLVAVVLYFIAVGLYQLSFHALPLPEWLVVHDLDELEDKLAQVVVVVLGIGFLGQAVTWDGQRDLLGFGVATALVIAALTLHLRRRPAGSQFQP